MIYKAKANAKINIGLNVLEKRKDGYHNIETVFYPVKLYDEIKLNITSSKTNKYKIEAGKKELNTANNLCIKAVKSFIKYYDITGKHNYSFELKKEIPIGAGLGGGSSDAAAVLKLLSKHFKLNTTQKKKLPVLALELGSDVPFFLINKPCYAYSRGEKLNKLSRFNIKYKILIVYPGINISTARAYNQLDKYPPSKPGLKSIKNFSSKNSDKFKNDFEKVIADNHPEIIQIKNHMYLNNAIYSSMSGSGSAVYGFFKNTKDLRSASDIFREMKFQVFIG